MDESACAHINCLAKERDLALVLKKVASSKKENKN